MKTRIKPFLPFLPLSSPFSRLPLSSLLLTFLTFFAASVASTQIPSSGLVGYWPFNSNANDESGNGNNGTVNGATLTTDRFGNANSAYGFDGVNDYVSTNLLGITGQNSRTIGFWFNSNNNNSGIKTMLGYGEHSSAIPQGSRFDCTLETGKPSIDIAYSFASYTVPNIQNNWKYYTVTYNMIDGVNVQAIKLYIDGVLQSSPYLLSNSVIINTGNLNSVFFGAPYSTPSGNSFNGKLDDIGIWNRALTPAEITQLYTDQTSLVEVPCTPFLGEDQTVCAGTSVTLSASGSSLACSTLPSTLQNGLVGYWPFCGNANDASGNGNNGTVNGATLTTDRFGNANSAYNFNGNSYVQVASTPALNCNNAISINAWVLSNSNSTDGIIVSKERYASGMSYSLATLFSDYGMGVNNAPGDISCPSCNLGTWGVNSVLPGSWQNLTSVWDGITCKLYLNGQLISTSNGALPFNGTLLSSNLPLFIGKWMQNLDSWGFRYFNGKIDDVSIHNRALSASEIQQLYTLGQSTYLWSTGATTPTINVSPTTTTTYTCTVTDANGNVCTDSVTVFVPQIEATDLTICAGETTTLSVSGINSTDAPSACPTLPTNLQTGLVGYWPFCGNANDASGNGNNGTVNGATLTTDRFGSANSAYSFDGNSSKIIVPNSSSLELGFSNYTLSAWIRTNSQSTTNGRIISKGSSACITGYMMRTGWPNSSKLYTENAFNLNCYVSNSSIGSVNNSQWRMVTVTITRNQGVKFYIDGVMDTEYNVNSQYDLSNGQNLFFGFNNLSNSVEPFLGDIDDITIYNRSLSAIEIQALYNLNYATYLWSNGATTPTINVSPTSTTTYICTVTTNGVSCTDSVTVAVSNPVIDLGADVTVCGTSTTLTAPAGYDSYSWSNGATTNTTTVTANGTYSCTVTQGGCSASDSIDVTLIDATIIASDSIVCAGETVTLSVPQGGSSNTACAALPTNLQTGLVGYWPFCGNANDVSGNGNNGTVNGATLTTDRFGNANSAYSFDGNDWIESLIPQTLGYTVSGWVFLNTNNNYNGFAQHKNNCGRGGGYIFAIPDGGDVRLLKQNCGECGNNCSAQFSISNFSSLAIGEWKHLVATCDAIDSHKVYLNGQLVYTQTNSSSIGQYGQQLFSIGKHHDSPDLYFLNGKADDFFLYNRALTAEEIQQLFTLGQTTYLWSNGATTPTINVSPTSTTTYTCTVTTNGVSCTDSVTVVVSQPVASITPNGIVEICQGQSIALTANGGGSYLWNTGAPTQSITVNTEAVYTVTVTDANGCTDTESQLVKVNFLPNIGVNNASVCSGQSATLTATGGLSYVWSPATGLSSTTGTTVTASPSTSTVYTVTGTGANGCTNTATAAVSVNAAPTATITPATATTFCQDGSVVLNANTGAGLSYQWRLNGNPISGATSSSYTANASGSYTVVVTNTSACSATSTATVVTVNALPTAIITPATATTFCQGGSVVLNANTGTGLSYQWRLNGNPISGATTSTYTANASGSYTVVVTNTSTCSATSTATVVTVNALPTAIITPATATTFCQGGSVVLNANTGTGLSYQWRLNGNPISGATTSTYTANASGSYTVVVTNTSTCSATSTATVVTVNALPTATITPVTATTFCQGGSVVLNSNMGTGLTYQWRLNGTNITGATSSSYTANASGSYTVLVTNTSACSATSTATVVTVNALPTATITPATATTFCQGGSVVLNANTGTGLSYQWGLNGTNITGATSSSYTTNASGSYTVVVTNTSTCSATSTATVVTVNALPTATITAATATTFCQGGSVVLNANTGTGLTYQWRLNGTNITGATTSTYTANATGSYTVVVTNTSTCSATSTATVVTVNALPTATITASSATTFCQGGSVVLTANMGTGLSYQWFNNTVAISGATSSSYTTNASGSYTVVVTNTSTCSATSTATVVTVNALPTSTITPATATTFCQGGSVVLNANTGTGLSYQWRLNGTNITGATSSSYTANASGSYTVVVTNTSTCSATSTATVVTVNALPAATITPATATTFCQGGSVVLNANTGAGLSYQWRLNGTNITGATSTSYTANASGSYTVVVTNTSTCSATSTATVVTVNALPTATITPATATTFCQGGSVVLNANTGAGLTYQWRLNGTNITGATTSSYTANASGSYTVVVTNTSTCSAISTATVVTVIPNVDYFADADGDGFGDAATLVSTCIQPQGYVTNNSDCDDTSADVNPAATEVCNHIDDDCSGTIDDGLVFNTYYADADGDTFGDANNSIYECSQPSGYVTNNTDCNDNNANQNAASAEICNGEDDDCDGAIDNGLIFLDYYADLDSDGFGAGTATNSCVDLGAGYVTNNTDCNDNNANQNTASTEICNGEDDDCDGAIDNGITFFDYYADTDGDGFGAGDVISSCSDLGTGYVSNNTDCDDTNANAFPGATEICNTIDDNCDGQTDEGVQTGYFIDNDGDTYGNPSVSILACTQPIGYTPDDTDCNDTDANINPGAEDIGGNGIDENCDGEIDNSIFELNATISLYPNPTRSELNIQVNSSIIGNDLYIFDAVGKLVFKQQLLSTQTTVPVSNFADGNYVVKVGEVVKRFEVIK